MMESPKWLVVGLLVVIGLGCLVLTFVRRPKVPGRTHMSWSLYALTELGRTLEPIVREVALWWVRHFMNETGPFKGTTPASVVAARRSTSR